MGGLSGTGGLYSGRTGPAPGEYEGQVCAWLPATRGHLAQCGLRPVGRMQGWRGVAVLAAVG